VKRLPRFVIVVAILICLLAAEAGARAIAPRLSSDGSWPAGDMAAQYDAIVELSRHTDQLDVVFAGSSMIRRAVDAKVFSRRTGQRAVNASLPASSNILLGPWLLDVVVPLLHPKTVVIGVASRDFNDNTIGNGAYTTFVTSPGYQQYKSDTVLTRVDRVLSERSTLIRVRRSLRAPSNLVRALTTTPDREFLSACLENHPGEGRYVVGQFVQRYRKGWLRNYTTGGTQTVALIDTIERLEARGIAVILLRLPTSPDYIRAHNDPSDLVKFETALRTVIEQTGVPAIDGRATTSTELFRDPIHLNCKGSAAFTATLVDGWKDRDGRRTVRLAEARP
jgi:hypothetical protein